MKQQVYQYTPTEHTTFSSTTSGGNEGEHAVSSTSSSSTTFSVCTNSTYHEIESGFIYVFGSAFIVLGIITLFLSLKQYIGRGRSFICYFSVTKLVFSLLPLACFARGIAIFVFPNGIYHAFYTQTNAEIVAFALPGYLTVSITTLLVFFWMNLLSKTHFDSTGGPSFDLLNSLKISIIIFNVVMYALFILFLSLLISSPQCSPQRTQWHRIEGFYASTLSLFVSLLTSLAGGTLISKFHRNAHLNNSFRKQLIWIVAFMVVLLFLYIARSISILCAILIDDPQWGFISSIAGWGAGEFLPQTLITITLYAYTKQRKIKESLLQHRQPSPDPTNT